MARKTIATLEQDLATVTTERDALATWFRYVQRGDQPYTLTIDDREDGRSAATLEVYGIEDLFGGCVVIVRNLFGREGSHSQPYDIRDLVMMWRRSQEKNTPGFERERRLLKRCESALLAARGRAIGSL